jgi:hypothetical protein
MKPFLQKQFNIPVNTNNKTYRAIRHDIVRAKQSINSDEVHHPKLKQAQIQRLLTGNNYKILELFAGQGNLTKVYSEFGTVDCFDKKSLNTGDSYRVFHRLISESKTYDVVDIDPYGFPNRFFPDVFLLIESGYLFVTMPKPYVNILNGITQTHLNCYFNQPNPNVEAILYQIATWGLCHWRKVILLDSIDLGRLWRFGFSVEKVKATDYTNTKNK